MNPMQYEVNAIYRQEMERAAAKERMASEVMQQRPSSNVMWSVVQRVAQMVSAVWMPNQQEAIPARLEPKASA